KTLTIKNSINNDMNSTGAKGTPTTIELRESLICISTTVTDNFQTDHDQFYSYKNPACHSVRSTNTRLSNHASYEAKLRDGGLGYTVQNVGADNLYFEDIGGDYCRHVDDLSMVTGATLVNVGGTNTRVTDIDLHGYNENDIKLINCRGSLQLTNNLTSMP